MEKKTVWLVLFDEPDFSDCTKVFSTKEKATTYLKEEFERLSDIWVNLELEDKSNDCPYHWETYSFQYIGEDKEFLRNPDNCGILIEEMPIY